MLHELFLKYAAEKIRMFLELNISTGFAVFLHKTLTFMRSLLPLLNFDPIKLKLKIATVDAYLKLGEAEQLHYFNLLLYSQLQRAFDFVEV